MNTKSCLFLFALSLFSFSAFAQREETLLGDRSWGFSGVWGGYTHQYTQFGNVDSYNRGGFFTFEFGKSLTLGWGRNGLQDRFVWKNTEKNFDMNWNFFKTGYAFLPYKAVHPLINVDYGRGTARLGDVNDRVYVVQPSAGIEINVFRWFRLGLEGGYRFVSDSNIPELSNQQLSGAFGQASLRFGFSWGRFHKKDSGKKTTND
jgi:hypothetical protein